MNLQRHKLAALSAMHYILMEQRPNLAQSSPLQKRGNLRGGYEKVRKFTYVSTCTVEFSAEDLRRLGEGAQRHNNSINVTGFLMYYKPYFFQTLEGRKSHINEVRAYASARVVWC